MRPRSLVVLVLLGLIAVAGGWYFGTATTPSEQVTVAAGGLMFPGLTAGLQNAANVEITHQGQSLIIEKRPDGGWGVASMHDYPVQETKLRGMLTALTELRLTEPRTSDPSEYARLGVDNPDAANATADRLRVVTSDGKPIAELIVGHRRVRSQANVPEEVYVRRPNEVQSWLAQGSLQVDADAAQWLDRDIMNIKQDRIASVMVGDKALAFGRADGKFTLTQPADHPRLEDYKVDDVARALEAMTFQAVKADADGDSGNGEHAVFTTTDGLAVTVTLRHADKDVWARFAAAGGDKAEADRLNGRLAGWTYQIGAWKEKSLVPTLDDLKAEDPPKPAPAAPAASLPAGSLPAGSASTGSPPTGSPPTGSPSAADTK